LLSEKIYFGYDEARLTPAARAILEAKASALRANPHVRLIIGGHTDERGSDEYNLALGMRRAKAAQSYLVRLGVSGVRLQTESYGEERAAALGHDERSYAANRRAEFLVADTQMSRQ
jgi:peptidoglycan-associated lipoprotein